MQALVQTVSDFRDTFIGVPVSLSRGRLIGYGTKSAPKQSVLKLLELSLGK